MSTEGQTDMFRHAHHGVCHRCGWRGAVAKVRRRDRKMLQTGRSFGYLCRECTDDLLHIRTASQRQRAADGGKQKPDGQHRVA
jgi:hypothetical protein